MATKSFDRVYMTTSTTGTGTVTLGAAVAANTVTFAQAGAVDTDEVNYVIEDGTDFEIGVGTLGSSATTLTRTTVLLSKASAVIGTSKLTLSGSAKVRSAETASHFNSGLMRVGVSSVSDHSDVDLTTSPPSDGDGLVWDDGAGKLVPGPAGGGMFKGNDGTVGSRSGDIIRINAQSLTADTTIAATENASAAGPLTVADTYTLTVTSGGTIVIV